MSYLVKIRGEKIERYIDDERGNALKELLNPTDKNRTPAKSTDWVTIGQDQILAGTITGIVYEPDKQYRSASETLADPKYREPSPEERAKANQELKKVGDYLREKGIVK